MNGLIKNLSLSLAAIIISSQLVSCLSEEEIKDPPLNTESSVTLTANQLSIDPSTTLTLSWSSENVIACIGSEGWSGTKLTEGSEIIGFLSQDTTFILTCEDKEGASVVSSVTVTVISSPTPVADPIVTLNANQLSVDPSTTLTLVWSSENTTSCIGSGGWSGTKSTDGSEIIGLLTDTTTFILTCENSEGIKAESTVTVAMISVPITGALTGLVDTHFINRELQGSVYIFEGTVQPDDTDGNGVEPLVVALLKRVNNCTWGYTAPNLPVGDYTIAYTNETALDNPSTNDTLNFIGTQNISYTDTGQSHDFTPLSIIKVGSTRTYATPSEAYAVAQNGDVIEIDAGIYDDDIVVWRQNNITLRGVGGRAHIRATAIIPYADGGTDAQNGMGLWVTRGSNISVENIEFSGAAVPDENGAGIRATGTNLTVCNCYFHENENGILGGSGTILIEFSEFNFNGHHDIDPNKLGQTHNLYIDGGSKLIFQHNYTHHAFIGHNLKSRAQENYILYNRIMDEANGFASYEIDIPDGGLTYVIGNVLQKGVNSDNRSAAIAYAAESLGNPLPHKLYVVNNTYVDSNGVSALVSYNINAQKPLVANNLVVGTNIFSKEINVIDGVTNVAELITNVSDNNPNFQDAGNYNYKTTVNSPGINDGTLNLMSSEGLSLIPLYQYLHPINRELRPTDGAIDIGAFEYQ